MTDDQAPERWESTWKPTRTREQALSELRSDAERGGLTEGYEHDDLGRPVAGQTTITAPSLPPDDRPDAQVCQICIRSVRPERRVWIRPERAACRVCATECERIDPAEVDAWLRTPRGDRRLNHAMQYGIDPATSAAVPAGKVAVTHFYEDQDGLPLASVTQPAGGWHPVHPRCYFDVARERTFD